MNSQKEINIFDHKATNWDSDKFRLTLAQKAAESIISSIPLTKKWSVFELGAGTGLITTQISPLVKSITAADTSKGMLQQLRKKIKTQKITNILPIFFNLEKKKKIPETQYDMIFSSMTLHHIKDIPALIQKIFKMLKKGGVLSIVDLVKEDGTFHSDHNGVWHNGFDKKELSQILADFGFQEITFKKISRIQKKESGKTYSLFRLNARASSKKI
jgi:ubiquinone/menaquinone biosynthesis C-methylase UbiE